jgi:hypothetical protein
VYELITKFDDAKEGDASTNGTDGKGTNNNTAGGVFGGGKSNQKG